MGFETLPHLAGETRGVGTTKLSRLAMAAGWVRPPPPWGRGIGGGGELPGAGQAPGDGHPPLGGRGLGPPARHGRHPQGAHRHQPPAQGPPQPGGPLPPGEQAHGRGRQAKSQRNPTALSHQVTSKEASWPKAFTSSRVAPSPLPAQLHRGRPVPKAQPPALVVHGQGPANQQQRRQGHPPGHPERPGVSLFHSRPPFPFSMTGKGRSTPRLF